MQKINAKIYVETRKTALSEAPNLHFDFPAVLDHGTNRPTTALSVSCKHPIQPPGAPLSTRAPKIWQKSNENWPSLLEDAASDLEPDCIIPDSEGQQLLEVEELKPPAWMGNITTIEKLRNSPEIHEMTVKPQLNSRDIMHS
jgi:hypothetical protein